MKPQEFIKNIQSKPYETRTRILWGSTAVAGVLVVGVWFMTFQKQIKNLNVSAVSTTQNTTSQSAQHYMSIDSAEIKDGKLLLYFSLKNDTNDILNFSKLDNITLNLDGKDYKPVSITDRTNKSFIAKALSNSQNFGILTFESASGKSGQITFDSLYFEQSPQDVFKESIDINLTKLPTPTPIRN